MINSVSIIGSGQIGTSIALALAQKAPNLQIHMSDIDAATPDLVKARFHALNIPHAQLDFSTSAKEAVIGSDLVILATPLSAMGAVIKDIKGSLGAGTIVTDTGSAKEKAIASITDALADSGVAYVPAHPGNGGQGSGPTTGNPNNILGANSWMFIIEEPGHNSAASPAHTIVKEFWESAGVQVATTDTQTHDKFFGTCSHFEHLLVFTYLNLSNEIADMKSSFNHGGTSFRNLTRVAISPLQEGKPSALVQMWRPIFEQNRDKIIAAGENFLDHLQTLIELIAHNDEEGLKEKLTESYKFRCQMTDREPRENIKGEISDIIQAALTSPEPTDFLSHNLILPLLIAHAQTLNARDIDPELVKGKANPSFRDGTALALNNPVDISDILIEHKNQVFEQARNLKWGLQNAISDLKHGKWYNVEFDILSAQTIRTPLAGPRKGKDVREEYTLPKVV